MAGEGDAERLVVLLEARIKDFEKNMAKASGTAGKTYGGMRRDSKTATERMEQDMVRSTGRINRALASTSTKIGTFGKSLIAGFAGGLVAGGIAGITSRIGQLASAVASVGDEAKRAGVNVEAFQELGHVARQNRIGIDSLTDGLKELNLRADEWIVTGGGAAAEAFERLGYTADDLKQKLKDPSALFTEIIGKLGQLDKAAQIRIADEIFGGTGGEKFVQLIEQGEAGIQRTIQEARNLGLVMDQELIDKAGDLSRAFEDVSTTVSTRLQQAIVNASWALFDFFQQFKAFEDRTTSSLEARLEGLGRDVVFKDRDRMQALSDAKSNPMMAGVHQGFAAQLEQEIADLRAEEGKILQILQDRKIPIAAPVPSVAPTVNAPGGSGGSSRTSAISEAEKQAKAVQNLIAGLEFERSLIGLSAIEQAKLTAIRQAGAAATEDQRDMIGQLVEQNIIEQQQIDHLTSMYDMLGQAGMGAVQGIIGAMEDGKITTEEWGAILSDVLKMAGNFFLNAAFGGLTGGGFRLPGFASGTPNTGGARGEPRGIVHGQEAVIPLPSGGKVPVQVSSPVSQGPVTPQPVDVTISVRINGEGNIYPYIEKVTNAALRDYHHRLDEQFSHAVQEVQRNPRRVGGILR